MKAEIEPDDNKLHHLFRMFGMSENEALTAVQEIRSMAGQNILAKMEAQTAELRAQGAEQSKALQAQGAEQSKALQAQLAEQAAELRELKTEVRNFYRTIGIFVAVFGVGLVVLQIAIEVFGK